MSYVLKITNPAGEFVVSDDGYGLNYVGKAAYQSVSQASGVATTLSGRDAGKVVYRITGCPSFPVPFHTIPSGYKVGLLNIVTVGGGTYDLEYHCEIGSFDTWNFGTQVNALEVFVFARKITGSTGYVFKMWDAAGNLAYDLTDRPLFPRERKHFANVASAGQAIGIYTKPAFFGNFNAFQLLEALKPGSSVVYQQVTDHYGYVLTAGTLGITAMRRRFSEGAEQFVNDGGDRGADVFIIEATALP